MTTAMKEDRGAERQPVSPCPLCQAPSNVLYDRLKDELCGSPGEWRLARCSKQTCGLVFLDPRPGESETASAYEQYYTHEEGTGEVAPKEVHGPVRLALHRLNLALLRAGGATAERRRVRLSYLGDVPAGRLLEVGCGSGWRLAEFRRLGWDVVGQEVDEKAATHARESHGLTVLAGPLEELGLRPSSFDAVVLNHVIEHVPEPVRLLDECWRLVRQGGRLVCVTPNTRGLGQPDLRAAVDAGSTRRGISCCSPSVARRWLQPRAGFARPTLLDKRRRTRRPSRA